MSDRNKTDRQLRSERREARKEITPPKGNLKIPAIMSDQKV